MNKTNALIEQFKRDMESFDEKFKCINADRLDCDSKGNIPVQVGEVEWEAEQCQYCFERLFKYKSHNTQSTLNLINKIIEECEGMNKTGNNGEGLPFENSPEIYGNKRQEAYKKGYNSALIDTISQLQEFKEYLEN